MRPKLTYANVVATLALFIAIGGASAFAASQLGKNSVGPKQLKKNAVTTAKVKKEAITAAKIKKGTLTGTQINASTLGTVPSAVRAQNLGGISVDQIEQSSKLRCPGGTELVAGVCFETVGREGAGFVQALEVCGRANRSMANAGEFVAYALSQQTYVQSWVESLFIYEGKAFGGVLGGNSEGISTVGGGPAFGVPGLFHCVTQATN
jgi:hypothetical protein